ncbi:electron transport complex subunit C [Cellvibrio zantedeschiae]|uniref:Ion-translocating oxidoreductase complex subunit C n=1 Tax=Cellvibrio zantedeschiae TaxID=1237077 RepID=A0ABQ3AZ68_9GAMM|nr:electron transport complex subunit RsxC [Cellvibrio zantedeschiae]GGY68891.1 electron transport complex subunit C [Cellvibrio zantedeschiae]
MNVSNVIKIFEFPGGIYPPENKTQSMQLPLGSVPIPPQLIIPLNQHIGAPAKPIVQIGDKVLAGQLIAAADGTFSANVHASSSGVVSAINNFVLPHPSGMSGECITITTDGKHESFITEACEDFTALDPLRLLDKIRAAGVIGLGGAGFPTSVKLNIKSTQKIDTLIINGAECEPYITADDMLMQARADDIIAGSFLLAHILHNPKRLVIAVEDNKPKAIAALQTALKNYVEKNPGSSIEIIGVPTKYPSGGAKQLIQIITGHEIPHGHHSADINASCVNVGTAAAAWRAVHFGEPLTSRITTVVGESLDTQRNIDVLIGTPIDYVLKHHGFNPAKASRVIMGGSMMGFTLHDLRAPVIKTTNCILAPTKKEAPIPPPAQACIRCGLCSEVCPASLLPQQLFWYAQAEDTDRLQAHNLFDCIECGACSYVCPSKIPLVQYYRAAKGNIRQQLADKEKADRSRQRFEFRQTRIEKEEAAKEVKRVARKKAADEVKQKLAEQKAKANDEPVVEENILAAAPQVAAVVTAVAKANSAQPGFEEQKSRLERIVGAAKNSLESARAPLVPKNPEFPITEEQLVRQQSRIKQTELKLAEAEKKLSEFLATANSQPTEDLVTAAMARAQTKLSLSPAEKLRANLEALEARLQKAQEKAEQAKAEASPSANALQLGVVKMQEKIADVKAELAELEKAQPKASNKAEQTAVEQAMQKAKARAESLANMSEEEKRADQIKTMEARLQKAKERLARAESENDPHVEAFKKAVINIEEKLKELL